MSLATAARRLAAAVALAVLAAGCSGRAAGSAKVPAPTTVAGYYAQRLDWQPCDDGFECARLLVPFDYARPSGRRFSLPVVKLPAGEESHRVGALVVNPGGPGGSGVQYALGARSEFPAAVLARFDIVGFDPRGVAASQPALTCMTGPELDTYLATDDRPANAAQLARIVSQSQLYAARCAQNSAALLPYVGTRNAARDMDVLRAALASPGSPSSVSHTEPTWARGTRSCSRTGCGRSSWTAPWIRTRRRCRRTSPRRKDSRSRSGRSRHGA